MQPTLLLMHSRMPCAQEHYSNPSVIQYVTFNEGWGQYDTQHIVQQAKAWDPSRLMDAASGWVDPQDSTSFFSNKPYDHYKGYVRTPTFLSLPFQPASQPPSTFPCIHV